MGIAVPGVAVGTWALWGISAASGVSAGIRSKRMRDKSGAALLHRDHGSRAIIVFGTYVLIAAEFVLRFNRIGWVSGPLVARRAVDRAFRHRFTVLGFDGAWPLLHDGSRRSG